MLYHYKLLFLSYLLYSLLIFIPITFLDELSTDTEILLLGVLLSRGGSRFRFLLVRLMLL